jgi:predicted HAD superfamily phosphohydrolase YqeG
VPTLIIYVDVDDTLVRSVGSKRIPMPATVDHIRQLAQDGAELYLWSRGGAAYARAAAEELGLSDCFRAFLPKPNVVIDDESIVTWRSFLEVHPSSCRGVTTDEYRSRLGT